jgi:outer membrane receptor protein involved in Fe transport
VLIDGRRFPGKTNEIASNLRRLAPASVERIELISGAAVGISTQSSGILLNVVLRPGTAVADVGAWELNGRFDDAAFKDVDGLLAYTHSRGGWTYKAGLERNVWSPPNLGGGSARWSARTRAETYFYPSGNAQELRSQDWQRAHNKWIYTGGLRYDFVGGKSLDLNAYYLTLHIIETDNTAFTRLSPAGALQSTGTEFHRKEGDYYTVLELSAEYEASLGAGQLNSLAIHHRDSSPTVEFRNQQRSGALFELSRSEVQLRKGEDIGRVTWTRPLGPRRSLEVGGELARNTLDQDLQVAFDLNGDGRVEPVAIPTAVAHVQEARGEAFATLRLTGGGRTSFEGGVTYERSRITNNYPFSPEQNLAYLRPRLDFRLTGRHSGQFRATVERKVSQLDFNNFVPKFNVVDSRIDAGNPQLRPEQTWSYELGYQQHLGADAGLVELRAYYDDITGAIEKVPLSDARGLYSAQGNVPAAHRAGAEMKASIRLQALHLRNALLSLRYNYQHSKVPDPFTGEHRRLASDYGNNYDIAFRHDLLRLGGSYGFSYKYVGSEIASSDLLVRTGLAVKPTREAFVEKKLGRTLVLRLEVQNIGHAEEVQRRTLYTVNPASTVNDIRRDIFRSELYDERRDTRFALRLRGRF